MKLKSKNTVNKKKKLQTTLGKAAETPNEKDNDDDVDISHVGRSIDTSIHGLQEVVTALQNATTEVKHYLTYECDVLYECRVCRAIFRSLANFILHKREYCRKNYNPAEEVKKLNICQGNIVKYVSTKESSNKSSNHDDELSSKPPHKLKETKKNISAVLEKLVQKQEQRKNIETIASIDLSKESSEKDYEKLDECNMVALEKIGSNSAGVFQTMLKDTINEHETMDCMRSEVMELHDILSNKEAVLGPDGKVCPTETKKQSSENFLLKSSFVCTICNQKFSTKKTLTYHVKYKHNGSRMVYQCPLCKDQFANAWCVFRHLYNIHKKTSTQIRKMRDGIHANAFRKDQEPLNTKVTDVEKKEDQCNDLENQWMESMESDIDLQMCGGCGKRFERKAALNCHSQTCLKRIAICNTIKEKNMKQALEEARNEKITKTIDCQSKSSRRNKPIILRKKHQNFQVESDKNDKNKRKRKHSVCLDDEQPVHSIETETETSKNLNKCDIKNIEDVKDKRKVKVVDKQLILEETDSPEFTNSNYLKGSINSIVGAVEDKVLNPTCIKISNSLKKHNAIVKNKEDVEDKNKEDTVDVHLNLEETNNSEFTKPNCLEGSINIIAEAAENKIISFGCTKKSNNLNKHNVVKDKEDIKDKIGTKRVDEQLNLEKIENFEFTKVGCLGDTTVKAADNEIVNSSLTPILNNENSFEVVKKGEDFVGKSKTETVDKQFNLEEVENIEFIESTFFEDSNSVSESIENKVKNSNCIQIFDHDDKSELENINKTKADNQQLSLRKPNSKGQYTASGTEVIVVNPCKDLEPEFNTLSVTNTDLSVFRSSLSRSEIYNVIGVPLNETELEKRKSKEANIKNKLDYENKIGFNDNSNSNLCANFFEDNNSCNLDSHTKTIIKEIANHQPTASTDILEKLSKRKRMSDIEEKKAKRISEEERLLCKAKQYIDVQKCMCLHCNIVFSSQNNLLEHMSQHFNWYCYQCSKCNYLCFYEDICIKHISEQHTVDKSELENAVLTIPGWKTVKLHSDFVSLKEDLRNNKTIMNIIFSNDADFISVSSKNQQQSVVNTLPYQQPRSFRVRKKSIKITQDDFLYDFNTNAKKRSNIVNKKNYNNNERSKTRIIVKSVRRKVENHDLFVKKPTKVYQNNYKARERNSISSTEES